MSEAWPGVTVGDLLAFRTEVSHDFPRSLWGAFTGDRSPAVEVGPDGLSHDGRWRGWQDFGSISVSGGLAEPELICAVDLDGDVLVLLRTQADLTGRAWTVENLRAFAAEIARMADLPLEDTLGSEDDWRADAQAGFMQKWNRNREKFPDQHAGHAPIDGEATLHDVEFTLSPSSRLAANGLRITIDPMQITFRTRGLSLLGNNKRTLALLELDLIRVTYERCRVRSREHGMRVKVMGRVVSGPPEHYALHRAVFWGLSGTKTRRLGSVVVGLEGASDAECNWVASHITGLVMNASQPDLGDAGDVPDALVRMQDRPSDEAPG